MTEHIDTADLAKTLTNFAVDTTHVGYMLAAALQDATPAQKALLQAGAKPYLKTCERPYAASFPAYLSTVMGSQWKPGPDWQAAIDRLDADPESAIPNLAQITNLQ